MILRCIKAWASLVWRISYSWFFLLVDQTWNCIEVRDSLKVKWKSPIFTEEKRGADLKEKLAQAPCCKPHPGYINAPQSPKPQFRDVSWHLQLGHLKTVTFTWKIGNKTPHYLNALSCLLRVLTSKLLIWYLAHNKTLNRFLFHALANKLDGHKTERKLGHTEFDIPAEGHAS